MNGTGNHGSKVPLNLGARRPLDEPVVKAEPLDAQHERNLRAGSPPIRTGMFNGAMPMMKPPVPVPQGPDLVLKAVRDPSMANTGMMDKTPRKRGQDGKFAPAQTAGPQSTATDDLANREREAHLAAKRRYLKGLGYADDEQQQPPPAPAAGGGSGDAAPATGGAPNMPPNNGTPPPQPPAGTGGAAAAGGPPMPQPAGPQLAKPMDQSQPGVPGAVPGQPNAPGAGAGAPGQDEAPGMGQAGQDPMMNMMAPPMGQTPEGMPIYDDPYNPGHQSFTPDQHRYAAQLHNQQAEMMTTSGQIPQALDHQMKAQVHMDLANDAQSPMERMMNRQGGGGQNPMDQFLTQMGQQDPGMNNGQMGGPRPDQNKPLAPDASAGPIPGMVNTHTGGNVGMQSDQATHAGTMEQPQGMPPDPTGSSMPDISGPLPGQMQTSPFDYNPDEFSDVDTSGEEAVPGGGAAGAPPSNAGAMTQPGPDEGTKPTPGSTESEPPTDNAGPSTNDNNPFAGQNDEDEIAAAGGGDDMAPPSGEEPTDQTAIEEGKDEYKKAFDWFFGK